MRNELLIGMVIGACIGAFVAEKNQTVCDIVGTSSKAIKSKVKEMMPKKHSSIKDI